MWNFHSEPFDHQRDEVFEHGMTNNRGRFWEQGTGKSKPTIDEMSLYYNMGLIDGALILAPNGVHTNWVTDEFPAHMWPDVLEKSQFHVWYSNDTKRHRSSYERCLTHKGFAVLVMSYDAIMTKKGFAAWKGFLQKRRCFYVLDESHFIKSPGAKRTMRVMGSIKLAQYRRCLTGTPITNKPFDVYSQLKFIEPNCWKDIGIPNFQVFKSFFGIWDKRVNASMDKSFDYCVAFQNLSILKDQFHRYGTRVLKEDVLDLPEKLYSKRYVSLTPAQKKAYAQLEDDFTITCPLTGDEQGIAMAIVRLMRFQQIICGYVPTDDGDQPIARLPGGNPRMDLLVETVDDLPHQAIIWSRFTMDLHQMMEHKSLKDRSVLVNGEVTGEKRAAAIESFKNGSKQFLVANPAAISAGYTLNMAKTVVYYANSYNLVHRQQSEDRCHRIGQTDNVQYIDLIAEGTIDRRICQCLVDKVEIASEVTGDPIKNWI